MNEWKYRYAILPKPVDVYTSQWTSSVYWQYHTKTHCLKSSLLKLSVLWGQPCEPAGMGKGALAPENVDVFFLLQMLSKTWVDQVFMHDSEQISSASAEAS